MTSPALQERYGTVSPWRRGVLIGASVVLAVVFASWLVWTVADQSEPAVSSQLETFSVSDVHQVSAVVVVTLAGSEVRASCKLRAYAEDHTVVGELTFTPDPSLGRRQVQQIRTEREATSVESVGCTAPGQSRPR